MPNQKHTNMKTAWLAGFLFLSNQCVSDQRTQDVPGQLHESLKASSPNEKPFSPTVVKPHARKLAKASRRSCERPGKNERTFEQPPYIYIEHPRAEKPITQRCFCVQVLFSVKCLRVKCFAGQSLANSFAGCVLSDLLMFK